MQEENNIPDVIYQFYDFETGIEKVLKDKTIRFSNPKDFNDPFDIKSDSSKEEVLIHYPNLSDLEINNILRVIKDSEYKVLEGNSSRHRISCFSENYKEILMWSHYADKHKGICVGYNIEKNKDNGGFYLKVEYPKNNKFERKLFGRGLSEKVNSDALNHLISYKSK
ncbi:DUF2971 domain-containing protein [Flavicella sp.]|uniref:DUF2971 domain-containing protein n=1 Tax=Flavicella sp. TaxID=2957742 RepID=UPI003017AF89